MKKQFNEGDRVQFKNQDDQTDYERECPTPFTVAKSELKDLYSSGLSEDCWDEIVSVQDATGEIFAEVEADDLCKPARS